MKYKDIFKSWWFYVTIVVYALFTMFTNTISYGKLFLVEYLGIFIGSFVVILISTSIIFIIGKLFKKIFLKQKR